MKPSQNLRRGEAVLGMRSRRKGHRVIDHRRQTAHVIQVFVTANFIENVFPRNVNAKQSCSKRILPIRTQVNKRVAKRTNFEVNRNPKTSNHKSKCFMRKA